MNKHCHVKKPKQCQWLRPVILVTQEAEIRIAAMVRSQPGQIAQETLSQENPSHKKKG
jgi:hypothetical protein